MRNEIVGFIVKEKVESTNVSDLWLGFPLGYVWIDGLEWDEMEWNKFKFHCLDYLKMDGMKRKLMECISFHSITFCMLQFWRNPKISLFRHEILKQWNGIFIPFCSAPLHSTLFCSIPLRSFYLIQT